MRRKSITIMAKAREVPQYTKKEILLLGKIHIEIVDLNSKSYTNKSNNKIK